MSLSSKTELARALFRSTPPDSVTRISGTATADSSDGTVTVQLEDGDVIEVGTIGSVSAGDTVTIHVQRGEAQVIASEGWGDAMQAAVDEAQAIAEATGQHFWHDSNGAHVTEITQEQWQQSQTGHNILVNAYGMLLRDALAYLAAFTPSAATFYDGQGNDEANVTAKFGSDGARIGADGGSRMLVEPSRILGANADGVPFLDIDYGGAAGRTEARSYISSSWQMEGASTASAFSADVGNAAAGSSISFHQGARDRVIISALASETPTSISSTTGCTATINGDKVKIEPTLSAFTVGTAGTQMSQVSVASPSGTWTLSTSVSYDGTGEIACSVTIAASWGISLDCSATGCIMWYAVTARPSFTFGTRDDVFQPNRYTYSATIGEGLSTQRQHQVSIGRYNDVGMTSDPLFIIGNGTGENDRSNALEVDDRGNVRAAGGLSLYGGTAFEGMFHLATKSTTIGAVSANGGTKYLSIDITKTGYKALALVGYYLSGASRLHIYQFTLGSSGTTAEVRFVNKDASATSSTATIDIQVLYVRA